MLRNQRFLELERHTRDTQGSQKGQESSNTQRPAHTQNPVNTQSRADTLSSFDLKDAANDTRESVDTHGLSDIESPESQALASTAQPEHVSGSISSPESWYTAQGSPPETWTLAAETLPQSHNPSELDQTSSILPSQSNREDGWKVVPPRRKTHRNELSSTDSQSRPPSSQSRGSLSRLTAISHRATPMRNTEPPRTEIRRKATECGTPTLNTLPPITSAASSSVPFLPQSSTIPESDRSAEAESRVDQVGTQKSNDTRHGETTLDRATSKEDTGGNLKQRTVHGPSSSKVTNVDIETPTDNLSKFATLPAAMIKTSRRPALPDVDFFNVPRSSDKSKRYGKRCHHSKTQQSKRRGYSSMSEIHGDEASSSSTSHEFAPSPPDVTSITDFPSLLTGHPQSKRQQRLERKKRSKTEV